MCVPDERLCLDMHAVRSAKLLSVAARQGRQNECHRLPGDTPGEILAFAEVLTAADITMLLSGLQKALPLLAAAKHHKG